MEDVKRRPVLTLPAEARSTVLRRLQQYWGAASGVGLERESGHASTRFMGASARVRVLPQTRLRMAHAVGNRDANGLEAAERIRLVGPRARKCSREIGNVLQSRKSRGTGSLQVYDSKDGEMSEWLKEHAWKAVRWT